MRLCQLIKGLPLCCQFHTGIQIFLIRRVTGRKNMPVHKNVHAALGNQLNALLYTLQYLSGMISISVLLHIHCQTHHIAVPVIGKGIKGTVIQYPESVAPLQSEGTHTSQLNGIAACITQLFSFRCGSIPIMVHHAKL